MNPYENDPGSGYAQDPQSGDSQNPQTNPHPQDVNNSQSVPDGTCHQTDARQVSYGSDARGNVPPQQHRSPYENSPYANSPYMHTPPHQDTWGNPTYPPQPPKQKKPKGSNPWGKRILAGVLAVALVAAGSGITAASLNSHFNTAIANLRPESEGQIKELKKQLAAQSAAAGAPSSGPLTPSQVYAKNVSSVVAISSVVGQNRSGQVATSTGSGFILSPDGYVATNCHVVEGAMSITVTTGDNTQYEAKLLGKDPSNDVAVLKVEAQDLPAVTIGNSNDLLIGDMVVAIGNPLGELTATQTVGYIGGKDRIIATGGVPINMLQTDAAINSGNSGGPLFNMKGEVVGITTAKYSGTTGSGASIEGIGFAIPIDDVLGIMKDLAVHGYVTGPYLGVSVRDVDPQIANAYGIPLGAYVVEVVEDASADRAGLQAKDIIIAVDDKKIESSNDLIRTLRHYKPGDTITVKYSRSGAEATTQMTLDEKPQQPTAPAAEAQPAPAPSQGDLDEFYEYFDRFFGDFFGVPHP